MGGTFGSPGTELVLVIPMARNFPACMKERAVETDVAAYSTSPARRPVMEGAEPLYWIASVLMPAFRLTISMKTCGEVPTPAEPYLIPPGLALARVIRSPIVVIGDPLGTTTTKGNVTRRVTCTKSLIGS